MPPFHSIPRKRLRHASLLLAGSLCLSAVPALQAADAPATASAPSKAQLLPGKIVYAQLTTPDLKSAKAFYGSLLGWTFQDVPVSKGQYAQALVNGLQSQDWSSFHAWHIMGTRFGSRSFPCQT